MNWCPLCQAFREARCVSSYVIPRWASASTWTSTVTISSSLVTVQSYGCVVCGMVLWEEEERCLASLRPYARVGRTEKGDIRIPFLRTAKCRCAPNARPVAPDSPIC